MRKKKREFGNLSQTCENKNMNRKYVTKVNREYNNEIQINGMVELEKLFNVLNDISNILVLETQRFYFPREYRMILNNNISILFRRIRKIVPPFKRCERRNNVLIV